MSYYGDPIADVEYFKNKMIDGLRIPKEYFSGPTRSYDFDNNRTHKLMMDRLSKEIEGYTEQLAYPSAMRDAGIFLVK